MNESISYRSVQLLSPQVSQLESLVEVEKVIFSLSVKSCDLVLAFFFQQVHGCQMICGLQLENIGILCTDDIQ